MSFILCLNLFDAFKIFSKVAGDVISRGNTLRM
jgi:hypothetical protein